MTKYQILKIVWKDHVSHDGYTSFDNLNRLHTSLQETLGYLVNETKEAYYLAADLCGPTNSRDIAACDRIFIVLKNCIVKKETLGESAFLETNP
jgi:hypothetical protein